MSPEDERRVLAAVGSWIDAKDAQAAAARLRGNVQGGTRDSVTGGKHLAGVNQLIVDELWSQGHSRLELVFDRAATLPGWYRATKSWDLLALEAGQPILAVEYKSMQGSEGKNLNNRSDEVFGIAEDMRAAQAHGLLPDSLKLAYVFLMEMTPAVMSPVRTSVATGKVDADFLIATYFERMTIMCRRIRESGLYDMTWAIGVQRHPLGFLELDPGVGWMRFKADLAFQLPHVRY